jgi:hypothetical protein
MMSAEPGCEAEFGARDSMLIGSNALMRTPETLDL